MDPARDGRRHRLRKPAASHGAIVLGSDLPPIFGRACTGHKRRRRRARQPRHQFRPHLGFSMPLAASPLLTDLYELNMVQTYLDRGEDKTAVFEFFVRRLPPRRGFLLAAGLEDALDYLETMRYSAEELAWLKSTGRFRDNLLDYLANFRFTGDVH